MPKSTPTTKTKSTKTKPKTTTKKPVAKKSTTKTFKSSVGTAPKAAKVAEPGLPQKTAIMILIVAAMVILLAFLFGTAYHASKDNVLTCTFSTDYDTEEVGEDFPTIGFDSVYTYYYKNNNTSVPYRISSTTTLRDREADYAAEEAEFLQSSVDE